MLLPLVAGCSGERVLTVPKTMVAEANRLVLAPPLENARGVVGGPRDDTAFEFELEPPTEDDEPPVVDGAPPIPESIAGKLAPYLEASRTRVASVEPTRPALVVLTRKEEVTQAYLLEEPMGPLRQLTRGPDPVAQAAFVPGQPDQLLFRRDRDGDERYQLYRLEVTAGVETLLSDGESRHGSFSLAGNRRAAFSSNARAPGDLDVYVAPAVNPFTPAPLVENGGQWIAGAWARDGRRLFVRQYRSAADSSLFVVDSESRALTPIAPGAAEAVMRDARFGASGETAFVLMDAGGEHVGVHEVNLSTGKSVSRSRGISWSVEQAAVSRAGDALAFVVNEDGASVLYQLDLSTQKRVRAAGIPAGVISSLQYFGSGRSLALTLATATEPADAYVYDFEQSRLVRWTESESARLERKPFVDPVQVRVNSHGGVNIPAYLYPPAGDGPHPVLLWIHGGPEEQHRPSFDPLLQYFVVESGFAVLAPNIRGSSGYGRTYLGLDDGARREDAVKDIGALLDWIAARPDLDADRVGIFGASYGGYIVLASLVEYGQRIAAGCDLVGISHFVTFLENTGEYRREQRRAEYGDERNPTIRELLHRISPLTNAERIRTPLLVGHGANDPRVPVAEAEQIVNAVRANGVEVWYMLARDEGHGFRKRRSRDLFYTHMIAFFDSHLGRAADQEPAE